MTALETARDGSSLAPPSLGARLRGWLSGKDDHLVAQRMAGTAFLVRVISAAVAFISQVLLARWMGAAEFGIYVYVWTWVLVIGGIADIGLAQAAQRFVPEYRDTGLMGLLRGYIGRSRRIAFFNGTLLCVFGVAVVTLAEPWLSNGTAVPLLLAALCLPTMALTNVQDGIARSWNWTQLALVPPYIVRPVLMLVLMVAFHLGGLPSTATTAMIAAVVATWLTALAQLLLLERRLKDTVEPGPSEHRARGWLATSAPIMMVEACLLLLTYVDVLVLKHFAGATDVAMYYAATKTLALVAFVAFAVAAASAHRFAALHVAGDSAALQLYVTRATRWTFWPSLLASAVILALGKPFLWLFGPDFLVAYPVMFVAVLGLLARASVGPVDRLLTMLGEQRACAAVYFGAFLVNLVLAILLVPRFGMMGAAMSTATALVLESLALAFIARSRLGLKVGIWDRVAPPGTPA
jgi:O-antigen/teichoic acid export membrane protein